MERGKRKPSIDLIVAMACYFHVSTDYLFMGKDHDKDGHPRVGIYRQRTEENVLKLSL